MQSCTVPAGEASRNQIQVEHHSVTESNIANGQGEEEQPYQQQVQEQQLVHTPQYERHEGTKVKWPKVNDKQAWRSLDQDLYTIPGKSLRGSAATKVNLFGNIIYEEAKKRFGVIAQRKNISKEPGK